LFAEGNKSDLETEIQNHFNRITGTTRPDGYGEQVECWDVANEVMENKAIQTSALYTSQVDALKTWFGWARQYAPSGTQLFINETGLDGEDGTWENAFVQLLTDMKTANVDFDGVGIQGHFRRHGTISPTPADYRTNITPELFYQMLQKFDSLDKIMTLTEFDIQRELAETDREWEASFTRDIMIAVFSHPKMNGFLMWGFTSGSHWDSNAPVFDGDYNLKESGKQYIDLVYNKWWTNESGSSNSGGNYAFSGYYGDYDITVTVGGQTKTVQVPFYKGGNNTITVQLD